MVRRTPKPMHSKRLPPIVAAFSLLALMALAACGGGNVDIDTIDPADLETPTLLVERLPITVGVHYDENLRSHHRREVNPVLSIAKHDYYLGPPSIALFDALFSKMFETVVPVESPSTATAKGQKISGVLSLTIESFVAPTIEPPYVYRTRIGYSLALYAPPGAKKTSIGAHGTAEPEGFESFSSYVARAMRNAAADLVVNFYKDPEVVAWLASLGISEHGAEETSQ